MARLFLFAVGGTGARVMRSLTMLLAAGVKAEKDWEIVPIIIDPQSDNGDVVRTQTLLNNYNLVRNNDISTEDKVGNGFFAHKIMLKKEFYKFELNLGSGTEKTVGDYFGLNKTHFEAKHKDFAKLLFSGQRYVAKEASKDDDSSKDKLLDLNMEIGFEGNPNVGSVVLTQIADNKEFLKLFTELVNPEEDRIFIVSSIFGGTGASAFPVILKMLRYGNKDYFNEQKAEKINKMPIASLVVMPYFNIADDENAVIRSSEFLHKTKIALEYYRNNINNDLEVVYYIKDDLNFATYGYNSGVRIEKVKNEEKKETQKNDSHFVEFASALSVFDFLDLDFTKDEIKGKKDIQKGFAVGKKEKEMLLSYISKECCTKVTPKLFSFFALKKFFEDFKRREKYFKQPWNLDYKISTNFVENNQNLNFVLNRFEEWVKELQLNDRSLKLFNFERKTVEDSKKDTLIFNGTTLGNLFATPHDSKSYFEIDSNLNQNSQGKSNKFLDIFFESVEPLIPIVEGTSASKQEGTDNCIFKDGVEALSFDNMAWSWFETNKKYDESLIKDIKEPKKVTLTGKTSIPSPFAKLDVLNITLRKFAEAEDKENSNSKKIISRFLDVAELLFNYERFKESIEFVEWELKTVKDYNGDNPFLKALKLHLEGEVEKKNFKLDLIDSFFIIKYKSEIIGATSPITLFFATDDNVKPIQISPKEILFDKDETTHRHLNERNPELQQWFIALYKAVIFKHKDISLELDNLKKYLLSMGFKNEYLDDLNNNWDTYDMIPYEKTIVDENTQKEKITNDGIKTLGIEIRKGKKYQLINDSIVNGRIQDGCFPGTNIRYEDTIRIEDLFAEKIIQVPYEIDDKLFFRGNNYVPAKQEKGVLLPLKEKFFELFKVEDLKIGGDGKVEIEIRNQVHSIDVKLYIPIGEKGNKKIPLKKTYESDDIINASFSIAIFPFLKYPKETINKEYFIHVTKDSTECDDLIKIEDWLSTSRSTEGRYRTQVFKNKKNDEFKDIDCFRIEINKVSNYVIPKWPAQSDKEPEIDFAIDFGTSNTNIEYSADRNVPETLSFENISAHLYNENNKELEYSDVAPFLEECLRREKTEFIPSIFNYPHPTVFSTDNADDKNLEILLNCNIPHKYELDGFIGNLKTNIKWGNDSFNNIRKQYFREIMMLIRAKVLSKNGVLGNIVCFLPASMGKDSRNKIKAEWENELLYYFNKNNVQFISESIAPYYYYKTANDVLGVNQHDTVVTIDIGGGTSDILVYKDSKPILLTSLLFAGNALFGHFGTEKINAFADYFCKDYREKLKKADVNGLENTLGELETKLPNDDEIKNIAAAINSLLFSAFENPYIKLKCKHENERLEYSYRESLIKVKDSQIIFIYFYSAMIYHIKKIFELKKELGKTKSIHFLFSGSGSKILKIAGDYELLEKIAKEIFNDSSVSVKFLNDSEKNARVVSINPKRVTSMGGLQALKDLRQELSNQPEATLKEPDAFIFSGFEKNENKALSEIKKDNSPIIDCVEEFNEYFMENIKNGKFLNLDIKKAQDENAINGKFAFFNNFLKEVNNIGNFLSHAMEYNKDIVTNIGSTSPKPECTLLLFPVIGIINKYISKIMIKLIEEREK